MIIKDISFPEAQDNISYDEFLLAAAEDAGGEEALRFWEARDLFVVLGRTSKPEDDVKITETSADRVPVVRRISAGGTVLQGPGCLNYSLILSYESEPLLRDIRGSYQFILGKVCRALKKLDVDARFEPVSDIAFNGRKFSGNAQSRRRRFMLHHGTIMYGLDVGKVERYLKIPVQEPEYRKGRGHSDFLTNIPVDAGPVKDVIIEAFSGRKASLREKV